MRDDGLGLVFWVFYALGVAAAIIGGLCAAIWAWNIAVVVTGGPHV